MMRTKLLVILMLLFSFILNAQQMMGPPPGSFDFKHESGVTEIPFELILNHIVITAELNSESPLKLVLDTGMPAHGAMLYETQKIKEMKLPYAGQAMVGGPGGDLKPASIIMGATLAFPGIEFTGLDIVVMPEDENSKKRFSHHDGVIGYSFFSRFVMDIDFEESIIKVFQPESFKYAGKGDKIDVEISNNIPVVPCSTDLLNGSTLEQQLILDLGATGTASFNINKEKGIIPPDENLLWKAYGVSGEIDIQLGRIKALTIGSRRLDNVLATFTETGFTSMPLETQDGLLGMSILKRFDLVIDYLNQCIYLEPNKFYDSAFEINMSGIRYYRDQEKNMIVEEIVENSPALEVELKAADVILEINGKAAQDISENELRDLLETENEVLKLKLKRDDEMLIKEIKLRRLI